MDDPLRARHAASINLMRGADTDTTPAGGSQGDAPGDTVVKAKV